MLVHGPLTLTLMLQVLHKHVKPMLEVITSIEYRNIAPLYCDEEMRVCVKRKKQTDTGHSWDVWIEGPTGGMAVKAIARSTIQSAGAPDKTSPKPVEDASSADLPDVQTVAAQAQDTLHALTRENAGKAQLSQATREERRQLIRGVPSDSSESSQSAAPKPYLEFTPFSRQWRRQQIGKALRYLYMDWRSPLLNMAVVERIVAQETAPPSAPLPSAQNAKDQRRQQNPAPLSSIWRKQWIGKSLPYLYAHSLSPLINNHVVDRTLPSIQAGVARRTQAEEAAVSGFLNTGHMQHEREVSRLAGERKNTEREGELRVRRVQGFKIREMGSTPRAGFRAAERRLAHEKVVSEGKRRREEREGRADE